MSDRERGLPPRIRVYWSKVEHDIMVNWDAGCSRSSANYVLCHFMEPFTKELEKRGYDLSTLRFQIRKKSITEESNERQNEQKQG